MFTGWVQRQNGGFVDGFIPGFAVAKNCRENQLKPPSKEEKRYVEIGAALFQGGNFSLRIFFENHRRLGGQFLAANNIVSASEKTRVSYASYVRVKTGAKKRRAQTTRRRQTRKTECRFNQPRCRRCYEERISTYYSREPNTITTNNNNKQRRYC